MEKLIVRKGREASLLRFHRWVFSGALMPHEPLSDGCPVEIYSHHNQFLAWGYYNIGSIAVRILGFSQTKHPEEEINKLLQSAFSIRQNAGFICQNDTNAYRLVHGEGDGLPGLIIDIYNQHAVIQIHHPGIECYLDSIVNSIDLLFNQQLQTIVVKSIRQPKTWRYAKGNTSSAWIIENGLDFHVDWEKGQKTGFFIDQRDNRKCLMKYAKNRIVLNTFCYTGGFSVYAAKGGAQEVHSLDSSAWAIEQTQINMKKNGFECPSEWLLCNDAIPFLQKHSGAYDLIVLDPPAFAKSMQARHNAIQAYKRINLAALKIIREGGILFTFSCSQVIDSHVFRQTVYAAALESRRNIRVLHTLSQPADHPVNIFHPETEYLKGMVLFVE